MHAPLVWQVSWTMILRWDIVQKEKVMTKQEVKSCLGNTWNYFLAPLSSPTASAEISAPSRKMWSIEQNPNYLLVFITWTVNKIARIEVIKPKEKTEEIAWDHSDSSEEGWDRRWTIIKAKRLKYFLTAWTNYWWVRLLSEDCQHWRILRYTNIDQE